MVFPRNANRRINQGQQVGPTDLVMSRRSSVSKHIDVIFCEPCTCRNVYTPVPASVFHTRTVPSSSPADKTTDGSGGIESDTKKERFANGTERRGRHGMRTTDGRMNRHRARVFSAIVSARSLVGTARALHCTGLPHAVATHR